MTKDIFGTVLKITAILLVVAVILVLCLPGSKYVIGHRTLHKEHIILQKEIKSLHAKIDYLTWISTNNVNRQVTQECAN